MENGRHARWVCGGWNRSERRPERRWGAGDGRNGRSRLAAARDGGDTSGPGRRPRAPRGPSMMRLGLEKADGSGWRVLWLGGHCDDIGVWSGGAILELSEGRRDVSGKWGVVSP